MSGPAAEMLGAEGVSRALVRMLRARVNRHLARQRQLQGLTVAELPDVRAENVRATPSPLAELGEFPVLMVALEATDGRATNRTEAPSGSYDELVMLYRVSVYVWAMGQHYAATQLALQRYVLATRGAIITGRVLGEPESGTWGEVDLTRLREQYTDPMEGRDGTGFLAGGWVECDVKAHELVWTDAAWEGEPQLNQAEVRAGRVEGVDLTVHPALLDEGPGGMV